MNRSSFFPILGFVLLFSSSMPAAEPSLTIRHSYGSSAASSSVLHFSVQVSGDRLQRVFLIPEGLQVPAAVSTPPYEFSLWVPREVTGPHHFRALGLTTAGGFVFSEPVVVNLGPPETPISLSSPITHLNLSFVGDSSPLRIGGHFTAGAAADLTRAPGAVWRSSNTSVVDVDAGGLAIATGPGTARIDFEYGSLSRSIQVSVPAAVPGDLNGDGRVDQDDWNLLKDALGAVPSLPADARDLNHDGRIDAEDLALFARLCTSIGCAR